MLTFPTHLFNPARVTLRPAGAVISGGESLIGEQDVIRTDGGGFWTVTLAGVELLSPDQIRAWRAWEDHLDGGVTKVLVPVPDVRQAPRTMAGGILASPSRLVATSGNPYFPEATAFATPFVVARTTQPAPLRATAVTIEVERGHRLRGGEVFAITHPTQGRRCYRTGRILGRSGQIATVTIRTPLREAIAANTACDFDWPSLVCTLVPDTDISPELSYGRSGTVDITFREAF